MAHSTQVSYGHTGCIEASKQPFSLRRQFFLLLLLSLCVILSQTQAESDDESADGLDQSEPELSEEDADFHEKYKLGSDRVVLYHEWERPMEVIESEETLMQMFEGNGEGTENNVLLGLFDEECESDLHENPIFQGAHYRSGPIMHIAVMQKDVVDEIEDRWELPSNCSHILFIRKGLGFYDHRVFKRANDASLPGTSAFLNDIRSVSNMFFNNYGKDIRLFWYESSATDLGIIQADGSMNQNTFLGHVFIAEDAETGHLVSYWVIDNFDDLYIEFDNTVCDEQGLQHESEECDKAMRADMMDWSQEFWARKREALNYAQPRVVRQLTPKGFKLSKLPNEIFEGIRQFWERTNNERDLILEGLSGPVMNQPKSPTYMTHLPNDQRQALTEYFRPLLSEWSGLPNLHLTSLYGIRKYTRGAILQMHVDTCATHVVSAIINVDSKLDSGKDWPLQIYDHNDTLHEFSMKPGDVVYYESAKNGHSRFKPLPGEYYSNVFIHFAPDDNSLWDYRWF